MRGINCIFCRFCVGLVTLLCLAAASDAGSVTLVESGRSRAVIVVRKGASATEQFAASELQRYIERATGAKLDVTSSIPATGLHVWVGNAGLARAKELGDEGVRIEAQGQAVRIMGGSDRGTLYGVYTFLEKHVGVRWYAPGDRGEWVPKKATLRVPEGVSEQKPAFAYRSFTYVGHPSRGQEAAEVCEWLLRNRVNVVVSRGWPEDLSQDEFLAQRGAAIGRWNTHSWLRHVPPERFAKSHPEYYALGPKGRSARPRWSKLCTTNPELLRVVAHVAREDLHRRVCDRIYPLTESDGLGWCTCPRCQTVDDGRTWRTGTRASVPVTSNRMVLFANAVAGHVQPRPGVMFYVLAYHAGLQTPRPALKPANRVMVQVVHSRPNFNCFTHPVTHECPRNRSFRAHMKRWIDISPSVTLYDYIAHSQMHQLPWVAPHKIVQDTRYYRDIGLDGFLWQARPAFSPANGLNFYAAARAMWDPDFDVDAMVADYCRVVFHEAAAEVQAYLECLERARAACGVCINLGSNMLLVDEEAEGLEHDHTIDEYFTPPVLAAASGRLAEAQRAALTPDTRANVAELAVALEYAKRFVAARQAVLAYRRRKAEEDRTVARDALLGLEGWLLRSKDGGRAVAGPSVSRRFLRPAMRRCGIDPTRDYAKLLVPLREQAAGNLALNPGGEVVCTNLLFPSDYRHARADMTDEVPVGWGCYVGGGSCRWGACEDSPHSGRRCVFMEVTEFHRGDRGKGSINVSLIPAVTNGYLGRHAIAVEPNTTYEFSLWLRGDLPSVQIAATGWTGRADNKALRQGLPCSPGPVKLTPEWRRYAGTITTRADTRRLALRVHLGGNAAAGAKLGRFYVDDVAIRRAGR